MNLKKFQQEVQFQLKASAKPKLNSSIELQDF